MSDTLIVENETQAAATRIVTVSADAAARISELREKRGEPDLMLRVSVLGGGCSGFQYKYEFDKSQNDDDHLFQRDDIAVIVDDVSLDLLAGSEIHFQKDIMGAYFTIQNPNASSSCGCGSSFSI